MKVAGMRHAAAVVSPTPFFSSSGFGVRTWGPRCRGVLIVGETNTARTLMTEAMIKKMATSSLFVQSTGSEHIPGGGNEAKMHPVARRVLLEWGPEWESEIEPLCSKVAAWSSPGYLSTFDVMIRIVDEKAMSTANASQKPLVDVDQWTPSPSRVADDVAASMDSALDACLRSTSTSTSLELPSCLVPETPPHWHVHHAAGTIKRTYRLNSIDDKSVTSTIKYDFTDEYKGEPLFATRRAAKRTEFKGHVEEVWVMPCVNASRPMERSGEQVARFRAARDDIAARVERLMQRLQSVYDVQPAARVVQ